MALHVVDVSRYQVDRADPIDLQLAHAAGFSAINLGVAGGGYVRTAAARTRYVQWARELGMGVSTYTYLTGHTMGAAQAFVARTHIELLGGPDNMVHVVDVEDPSCTWDHVRDYVADVTRWLRRPVAIYTGRWFWDGAGRQWPGAQLSPYLWAAPNRGYRTSYPGDDSPLWTAGYGGWPTLAAMQYALASLPGTGGCSLSAIRDPAVWRDLSGGTMPWYLNQALSTFRAEVNARYPNRDKGSDGTIGDLAHMATSSDHNPDGDGSVDAWDMDVQLFGPGTPPAAAAIERLKLLFEAHPASRYWIHNGWTASRSNGWRRVRYSGANPHDKHVHWNTRESHEKSTQPWGLLDTAPVYDPPPVVAAAPRRALPPIPAPSTVDGVSLLVETLSEGTHMPEYMLKHRDHGEVFAAYSSGLLRHIGPTEFIHFQDNEVPMLPESTDEMEYRRWILYTQALQRG